MFGQDTIWAYLVHLSYNMWCDRDAREWGEYGVYSPRLRFDEELWNSLVEEMPRAGSTRPKVVDTYISLLCRPVDNLPTAMIA